LEECSASTSPFAIYLSTQSHCAATKQPWEPEISQISYPIWCHLVTWDHIDTSYNGTLIQTMDLETIWLPNNSTVTAL
jgi:hypothetical protein